MSSPETSRRSLLKLGLVTPVLLLSKSSRESENESNREIPFDELLIQKVIKGIETNNGVYEDELTEQQVEKLILIVGNAKIKDEGMAQLVHLESASVTINQGQGVINGRARLHFPPSDIEISCELTQEEETEPDLAYLEVKPRGWGPIKSGLNEFMDRYDVHDEVEKKLSHPYETVLEYLDKRLVDQQINLTSFKTEFTKDQTLKIRLAGEK